MKSMYMRKRCLWLVGMGACAIGARAMAQSAQVDWPATQQVNISGATLVRPAIQNFSLTNDWIDADTDGRQGFDETGAGGWFVDNLAPTITGWSNDGSTSTPTFSTGNFTSNNAQWIVQYRGVGSVNGLDEFVDWQAIGRLPSTIPSERGLINRQQYASAGVTTVLPGALQDSATGSPIPMTSVDIAVLDVPVAWAVAAPGSASQGTWNAKPNTTGYGQSLLLSNTGWNSRLASLTREDPNNPGTFISLNTNTAAPDANTVYDSTFSYVPVAILANRGTAIDGDNDGQIDGNVRMTDVQHLFVTGRMSSGENLVGATRSSGSGTHNAMMNSNGIDPAWGTGDNLGDEFIVGSTGRLGTGDVGSGSSFLTDVAYQPTNAQASSGVETATQNHRLAIGYTGIAGRADEWARGDYEILNVQKNVDGDGDGFIDNTTTFVRPTIEAIIDLDDPTTAYPIGGNAAFASLGDPFSAGGEGDNPSMQNLAARDFLRNTFQSVADFSDPGEVDNPAQNNMPGQGLASLFVLPAGLDAVQDIDNPLKFNAQTPNAELRAFMLANVNHGLGAGVSVGEYGTSTGGSEAGLVPFRKGTFAGVTYDDGVTTRTLSSTNAEQYTAGTDRYLDVDGGVLQYGTDLNRRNEVAGDFGGSQTWDAVMGFGDGRRDVNDIARMMQAYAWRTGIEGVAKPDDHDGDDAAGTGLAIDIIGDFTGDGNFRADDIRYFGDGLAMVDDGGARRLDRKAGFTTIDNEWATLTGDNNFFDTDLATGKTYAAGDARGDVAHRVDGDGMTSAAINADPANAFLVTPGANPVGADGRIDHADIDYVLSQFGLLGENGSGEIDWADQASSLGALGRRFDESHAYLRVDLSADINGDLKINYDDVRELVEVILGTKIGDVNLDGLADEADWSTIQANDGLLNLGWAGGDVNGDGVTDGLDARLLQESVLGDLSGDGVFDAFDVAAFELALADADAYMDANPGLDPVFRGDFDDNGALDAFDVALFEAALAGGGAAVPEPASLILMTLGGLLIARRRR